MKNRTGLLCLMTIFAALGIAPPAAGDHGAYHEHAPVACVNGVLVTSHAGFAWDPTGVTGSGTPEDPYVLQDARIDAITYRLHPALVLLDHCSNFHIVNTQTYGDVGRSPQCVGGNGMHDGDSVDFAIDVRDSTGILVENSIVKYGRLAGIHFDNASGQVLRSDVKVNFGAGVHATNGSRLNVTESYLALNGYFVAEDVETRNGWWLPSFSAAVYVERGANVDGFNNSFLINNNALVVDKTLTEESSATFNLNSVRNSNYREVAVLGLGENPNAPFCNDQYPPVWWDNNPHAGHAEPYGEAERYTGVGTTEPTGASMSMGLRPLQGTLPTDPGYDYTSDPQSIVNARLNFWGQMQGPSPGDTMGKVDVHYPLPVAPPATGFAGAWHASV